MKISDLLITNTNDSATTTAQAQHQISGLSDHHNLQQQHQHQQATKGLDYSLKDNHRTITEPLHTINYGKKDPIHIKSLVDTLPSLNISTQPNGFYQMHQLSHQYRNDFNKSSTAASMDTSSLPMESSNLSQSLPATESSGLNNASSFSTTATTLPSVSLRLANPLLTPSQISNPYSPRTPGDKFALVTPEDAASGLLSLHGYSRSSYDGTAAGSSTDSLNVQASQVLMTDNANFDGAVIGRIRSSSTAGASVASPTSMSYHSHPNPNPHQLAAFPQRNARSRDFTRNYTISGPAPPAVEQLRRIHKIGGSSNNNSSNYYLERGRSYTMPSRPAPYPSDNGNSSSTGTPGSVSPNNAHNTRQRKYLCPYEGCNAAFTNKGHVDRHYRVHTGNKYLFIHH
jgi:hypothetical protein